MTDTQPQQAAESQTAPPYAPFSTVLNFLRKLKDTVVPARVDKTLMNGMSGSGMNQLLHALRFLGLIGENGAVLAPMKELVDALGTGDWPAALMKVVRPAYADITRDVDLTGATLGQLRDAFKATVDSDGQVLQKCIRFYLNALESAEEKLSPHFKVPQPRSPSAKRSSASRDAQQDDAGDDGAVDDHAEFVVPAPTSAPAKAKKGAAKAAPLEAPRAEQQQPGMRKWPLHIPGKQMGYIMLPENITEEECEFLDLALGPIKLYAKQAAKVAAAKLAKGEATP